MLPLGYSVLECSLPLFSNCPTGVEDFYDVKRELTPVAARWKFIGAALGISISVLDNIESSHPGKIKECLAKMVTTWLSKNHNMKRFGRPTWKKLITVVAEPAAGNDAALARTIASKIGSKHSDQGQT